MTKAIEQGYCRICDAYGALTKDHVPPQGIARPADLESGSLTAWHKNGRSTRRTKIVQGGIRYRTICSICNNTMLGCWYDPELVSLSKSLIAAFNASERHGLLLPDINSIRIKPHRLARAVLGHLLAAPPIGDLTQPVAMSPQGDVQPTIRSYVLDPNAAFPAGYRLHAWFSLTHGQTIMRGVAHMNLRTRVINAGEFLKFFPLGFFLSYDNNPIPYPTTDITSPAIEIDVSKTYRFSLRNRPPEQWPEQMGDNDVLLINDEATNYAKARTPKYRKQKRKS